MNGGEAWEHRSQGDEAALQRVHAKGVLPAQFRGVRRLDVVAVAPGAREHLHREAYEVNAVLQRPVARGRHSWVPSPSRGGDALSATGTHSVAGSMAEMHASTHAARG